MTDTTKQTNTRAYRVHLGRGFLTWGRKERITDRYGAVWVHRGSPDHKNTLHEPSLRACEGMTGNLLAHVIKTRKSHHIGDILRGFYPSTPEVGEVIILGGESCLWKTMKSGLNRLTSARLTG